MEPVPQSEDAVPGPIPGQYKTQGSGGLDPMELVNAEEFENVAYRSPRIQTAPQVVRDARTGQVVTAARAAWSTRTGGYWSYWTKETTYDGRIATVTTATENTCFICTSN